MNPLLYIHIPFCDTKCPYCSFNSFTGISSEKERYFDALSKQLEFDTQKFEVSKFKTIFIGGGTPSTVESKFYEKLFSKLDLSETVEITVEANPNSANENWLREMKNLGVNRLSLGVQSFQTEKLKYLGRHHSGKRAKDILEKANKVGIERISLDLIYGTKFDNREFLEKEISELENLPIDHLSLYSLTIEEGTPFQKIGEKNFENISETEWLLEKISEKFPQYEISNFGNPSIHNLGYWGGENYLGLGSGAVGFWNDFRYYPERNPQKYIENPFDREIEKLSENDLFFEKLFLGFRSKIGVSKNDLDLKILDLLLEKGIVLEKENRIFNKNYLLADEVALKFL
ncbi:putative oxygen-independent coproporphyrinogen III oxidase [Thiovulum sp. ES]|nr:putative oxygen-independent coproporphyrinogen III oxidase [Thiovulum sp. ES]